MKTIAILVGDSALSSLLSGVLGAASDVQVSEFESLDTLSTYMRITPVDLVILNFDGKTDAPGDLARALHADHRLAFRGFGIMALTRAITVDIRYAAQYAGIDELIAKPMSPKHLCDRVLQRLGLVETAKIPEGYRGPERRQLRAAKAIAAPSKPRLADNVIQLFGGKRPRIS